MNDSIKSLQKNGKSFFWAGKILPDYYLKRAADLYLFCRKLDDIADQEIKSIALKKLTSIKDLITIEDYKSLNRFKIIMPKYLKNNSIAKIAIIDLLDGLIFDQGIVNINNNNQLIRYCYRVAGTVGVLMCIALECEEKNARKFAIDLGIAMQLTNIARDVLEDAKIGRRYLPVSKNSNLSTQEIRDIAENIKLNFKKNKFIIQKIKEIILLSDQYYSSGKKGLYFLPFKIRIAIAVASNVYREIAVVLERNSFSWYDGRVYTSLLKKIKVTIFTICEELIYKRSKMPIHNKNLHCYLKEIKK